MKRTGLSTIGVVILLLILTASPGEAQGPSDEFSFFLYLPMVGISQPGNGVPPNPLPSPHQQKCDLIAQKAMTDKKLKDILSLNNVSEEIKRHVGGETDVVFLEHDPFDSSPYAYHLTKARPTATFKVQIVIPKRDIWWFHWQYQEKIKVGMSDGIKAAAQELGIVDKVTFDRLDLGFTFKTGSGRVETDNPGVAIISNSIIDMGNRTLSAIAQATNEAMELAQAGEHPNSPRLRTFVKGSMELLEIKVSVKLYSFSIGGKSCSPRSLPDIKISSSLQLEQFRIVDIWVVAVYPWGKVTLSCYMQPDRINEFKVTSEYPVPYGFARFEFDGTPPRGPIAVEPTSRLALTISSGKREVIDRLGTLWGGHCQVFGACRITYILTDIDWNWSDLPGWTQLYPLGQKVTCEF